MKNYILFCAFVGLVGCGDIITDTFVPEACNNDYVEGFEDGQAECEEPAECDTDAAWRAGYEVGYFDGFGRAAELHGLGTPNYCWRNQYVNRIDRDPAIQWESVRYECKGGN